MNNRKNWWKIILIFFLYTVFPYLFQFLLVWAASTFERLRALLHQLVSANSDAINILFNLLSDLITFLAAVLLLRRPIRQEISAFWQENRAERKTKLGLMFPYGLLLMMASVIGFVLIKSWFHVESANQAVIDSLLLSEHRWVAVIMAILAAFFAPIIEEFIFRFGFYGLLQKRNKMLSYIVSAFLFGLAHVLAAVIVDGEWLQLLEIIPYGLMGVGLTLYYERCGNIGYSIFLHMLFNIFGVMSTLIG